MKDALRNHAKVFAPIRPTELMSPSFATPTTSVVNTSGATIILISLKNISARRENGSTFLSRAENVLIVALEHGQPIGYVVAYLLDRVDRDQRMMFFYEIGVAEPHRRRGIGKQLVEQLKSVCRRQDVMKMWVPTGRSNVAATRLYASTGATPFPSGDEVTYAYSRACFIDGAE